MARAAAGLAAASLLTQAAAMSLGVFQDPWGQDVTCKYICINVTYIFFVI